MPWIAEAGVARIDLDDQNVDYRGGVVRFEIDEEAKHRLRNGLDDIGITPQSAAAIDAFEAAAPPRGADTGAFDRDRLGRRYA